jgi:glycosyltransferase involved in cell wall biosynthesis
MPIGIDLRSLIVTGGKISGVENYLLNILNRLVGTDLDLKGFYNCYADVKMPVIDSRLPIQRTKIPNKIFNSLLTFLNQPKLDSLYGCDVIWMPDLRPFAVNQKARVALTIHDLSAIAHPEYYSLKRRIWHKVVSYRKALNRADVVFAVSEYTKYEAVKHFDLSPDKIKVIYPGINTEVFRPDLESRLKHKVSERYMLPDKYILFVSTIEPRKNITSLIHAFEQINDPELHLVLAGRLGWLYDKILKEIESSPKRNFIKLLGYVEERDKPYLISGAEMVCYPSYYEGFGFVPLEAMASGVPVLTSARTPIPEVCGDAALLVEPRSQSDLVSGIEALLTDHKLREKLKQKGFERVKKFSWENTVIGIKSELSKLA